MKKILTLVMLLPIIFLSNSCEDDSPTSSGIGSAITVSDEGVNFTITDSDGETKSTSDRLNDENFGGAQLLNRNFSKYLRFPTDKGTLQLWINIPFDKLDTWRDDIQGTHTLLGRKLLLQETSDLSDISFELYYFTTSDYGEVDFDGTITIFKDVDTSVGVYELAGEIDANSSDLSIEGEFWRKEFNW